MKLSDIFVLLGLSVMANGAWWAAAVQPVMLSIGTAFAALDLDLEPIFDAKPFELRKLITFKNDKQKKVKSKGEIN